MIRSVLIPMLVLATPAASLAASSHSTVAAPPEAVAATEYLFADQGVFELVAAPGWITDIALEPGEALVEANPIAAGDTSRWIIGDTASGEGASRRVHVLVKPAQAGLSTNLIINTKRRSYHLRLRTSSRAYQSQVSWRYPHAATLRVPAIAQAPVATPAEPDPAPPKAAHLNLDYRIKGQAPWRPVRVYDDGVRTIIEFGPDVVMTDLPPLFVLGADGKSSELVNYRVEGRRLMVDRLFDRAQLHFGLKRWERRVRIERAPLGRGAGQ